MNSSTFALSDVPLCRGIAQHHPEMNRDRQLFFADQMHPPLAALSPRPYSSEHVALPKVGQTRCYWALLTTSLQFLVLDPVLEHHLQDQATRFLDCSLLDFVHPDEKHSAQRDLGSVLEEQTLHGSVTRVRYCRLSRVRRLLGWSDSSLPYPPNFPAERIAVDSDYMAVYLVVNCVANGMVLCFIHAVVDIAPQADNDEFHKTGWSNWCSTYGFDDERARTLYRCLIEKTMANPKSTGFTVDSSPRVFQILRNQSGRSLVLSWPPDATLQQAGYISPTSECLAQLVQHVRIDYSMGGAGDNDASTSCTRRYKSVQSINLLTTAGPKTFRVESIFIPHGMIIFACHKIKGAHLDIAPLYSSMQSHQMQQLSQVPGLEFQGVVNNGNQGYDDPMSAVTQQGLAPHAYVQQWINGQSQAETQPDDFFWHDSKGAGNTLFQNCWNSDLRCADNSRTVVGTSEMRAETSTSSDSVLSRSEDLVPPLSASSTTTHASRLSNEGSRSPSYDMESPCVVDGERSGKERIIGGKNMGSPPTGVVKCAHCQTTHSPEWRKGPSGKKDLCNACGLRYSRSRAKKEGIISKKRRDKEKDSSSKHSRTQPATADVTNVSEDQILRHEGKGTESRSGQVLPAPSSNEQPRLNQTSSSQILGRPGVHVDGDPTSSTFFYRNETSLAGALL